MKTVLCIGGSDSSAGAGIQGDIKTVMANGGYALTVVTAITAQNSKGVSGIVDVSVDFVEQQIDKLYADFVPDAVKIGMLHTAEMISMVARKLREYDAKNVVIDPIMLSPRDVPMLPEEATETLKSELFPVADVITPNVYELSHLTGIQIHSENDLIDAAKQLGDTYGCVVVTKGERMIDDAADLYYRDGYYKWVRGMIIHNKNHHGAGAALSCAMAVNIAKGYDPDKAFKRAKDYITGALKDGFELGEGLGPINHGFAISNDFTRVLSDEELSKVID